MHPLSFCGRAFALAFSTLVTAAALTMWGTPAASAKGYNYMALRNQNGPSGVPLGGIGVGYVELAPNGRFTRIGINNWDSGDVTELEHGRPDYARGCFLAMWEKQARGPLNTVVCRRLVRTPRSFCGMVGYDTSTYRGLFPTARLNFAGGAGQPQARVSVLAYSGLIPHDVKDSSLPCFWIKVTLSNPTGAPMDVAVALSWTNLIGVGLRDVTNLNVIPKNVFQFSGNSMPLLPRVAASAEPYAVGQWKGLRQSALRRIIPKKYTYQNYVDRVAVMALRPVHGVVSVLPAYNVSRGDAAWKGFREHGRFAPPTQEKPLSDVGTSVTASAVAVRDRLNPGAHKTFRFLVTWYMPPLHPDRVHGDPRSYFGTADYNRYFQNYFNDLRSLVAYAAGHADRIERRTVQWQDAILHSNLPDWLQFKLINSAYTLYTNAILNKAGDFSMMEGGMDGLAGTMDVRLLVYPLYTIMFPTLNDREMDMFLASQAPDGQFPHFDANYFWGMAGRNSPAPTVGSSYLDSTLGFVIQSAKLYQLDGDLSRLRRSVPAIKHALAYVKSTIRDGSGIPMGGATYDDYPHPPIFSYTASMYLATMKAAERIARAVGDVAWEAVCRSQYAVTRRGYFKYLWNGRFFDEGCDIGGGHPTANQFHQGQLAGQFLSRYNGWGDIIPVAVQRSVFVTQFKYILSKVPYDYADKLWDMRMMCGLDAPGSQCWPFQLEAFTALPAIQDGYVADGLSVMKNIQLVNLSHGWTWSQNLWNPGERTRADTPVTWMVLETLAGASWNEPRQTLTLGPAPIPGTNRLREPVFFPDFWIRLDYQLGTRKQRVNIKILRTFGRRPLAIQYIRLCPTGVPTSEAQLIRIPRFEIRAGSCIDLSPYLTTARRPVAYGSVLRNPGEYSVPAVGTAQLQQIVGGH